MSGRHPTNPVKTPTGPGTKASHPIPPHPQHRSSLYRVWVYSIHSVPLETPEQVSELTNEDLFIYLLVLVHVIMEPEKSHDLSSASWRFRKASGIVWKSENQKSAVPRPRTTEDRGTLMSRLTQSGHRRIQPPCAFLF